MQNEHHFLSGTEGKEKWTDFTRELEMLGQHLSELSSQRTMGDDHIQRLNAQYRTVRTHADVSKQSTDQQIDELRKLACHQSRDVQGTLSDIRAKATAFEMWERSQPLRQGAQDVGEGLVRAWAELRASFGKAANRISSSETDMSPRPTGGRATMKTEGWVGRVCLGLGSIAHPMRVAGVVRITRLINHSDGHLPFGKASAL